MKLNTRKQPRRGAVLPLVAICMVALMGMLALAIDIGMVAIARSQAQNAADSAAMAGARTINGSATYNYAQVPINAITAATDNNVFGTAIQGSPGSIANPSADVFTSGQVTVQCGGFGYVYNDGNPSAEGFQLTMPGKPSGEPYSAVSVTVLTSSPTSFGRVFGLNAFTVSATSAAVHRPRDVVIIMDLSGSMRFESLPGVYVDASNVAWPSQPNFGRNVSMNPDPVFPQFGHYSATAAAALQGNTSYPTSAGVTADPANISSSTNAGSPVVLDIMSSGSTPAFSAQSASYATTPGGDNFPKYNGAYISTVNQFLNNATAPATMLTFGRSATAPTATGYAGNGYTTGPNYWGKTFFMWPPDPRGSDLDATVAANHANNGAKDWRQRFFFKVNNSTGTLSWLDQNKILFNPAGAPMTGSNTVTPIINTPQTVTAVTEGGASVNYTYRINYAAIFNWLKSNPQMFPSQMTSGRINYYSSIPDPTDTTLNNRFWTTFPLTNLSERFWKDYVDFVLGLQGTAAGTYTNTNSNAGASNVPLTACIGNGDMFKWDATAIQVSQRPDYNYSAAVNNVGGYAAGFSGTLNFNTVKDLTPATVTLPGPLASKSGIITGATKANPIVITSTNHGLSTGNTVTITGVLGNTNANGTYVITVITASTFSLNGRSGNASYTSGGLWSMSAITAATNASPIVITTGVPHNLSTTNNPQMTVNISGVLGNTAANGKWLVTVINATSFSLNGSTGNGAFLASPAAAISPIYYARLGTGSTFYELTSTATASGTLTATNTADIALAAAVANAAAVKIYTTVPRYMDFADNPYRPRHQFWFGPMTFVDWLGNYTTNTFWWPGNVHEAQAWACKAGIQTAIADIKNNHPNDYVGMAFFSTPMYNSSDTNGRHNAAVVPLGQNYQQLIDSLWFPPSTVTGGVATITPFDADFQNVPRAAGGTCPGMTFMMAYNMLSGSIGNLRTYATPEPTYRGNAGGMGRKGADRLVIFETDGAPNTRAVATLAGSGTDSYYPIRILTPANLSNASNQFPTGGSYANSDVYTVVQQITALDTASPPGYSSTRKKALVYSIGYGTLFDPAQSSASQTTALTFLQTIQYYGNTSPDMTGANFPTAQRIYGTPTQRINSMQSAFTNIMQSGVQVSIIQ